MPTRALVLLLSLCAAASGCASRPRPVLLQAAPADREALLGAWQGTYRIEGRRGGTIAFTLAADGEQASGDVLMIGEGAGQAYRRFPSTRPPAVASPVATESLTIRFVRAIDGQLTGALTPYWDPDRACLALATFQGVVDGDRMDGTFLSTCEAGGPVYTGRWTMRRTGIAPPP